MSNIKISAIIPAAGGSTRMGEGINKQFIMLGDMPVLAMSIYNISRCGDVCEVIIAARSEDIADIGSMVREYQLKKVKTIVCGGATRQQSVANCIKEIDKSSNYILIHDGARPLVGGQIIDRVVADAVDTGAATAGVPVKDTIKRVDESGIIVATPRRDGLYITQTPQVFEREMYISALNAAIGKGYDFTDDCQLVEQAGHRVKMSLGGYENIKITTKEDVRVALALLGYIC